MNDIALIGDLHFDINDYLLDSQLDFFVNCFIPYLRKRKIKKIAQFGDIFDNRRAISIPAMNRIISLFENDLKDFEFHCFPGNHDVFHRNSNEVNSLKLLSQFPNVKIYEEITKTKINGKNFLFVPWLYDLNHLKDWVDNNDCSDIDFCFGHFDLIGGKMSKTTFSKSGLTKDLLYNFKKVYSGHYHTRSVEKNQDKEIVYLGTPYQLNFGDSDEDRGFYILNCDDSSCEFIENDVSIKFISLNYPEEISESKIKGNIVNVFIDQTANIDTDKIQEYIEKINSFNPVREPVKRIIGGSANSDINLNEIKVKSLKDLFDVFVGQLKIEEEIKDDVLKEIDSLYFECMKME